MGSSVDKPDFPYTGREFEERFAAYQQAKYGILTSSGTSAIAVALRAAGVGFGDEVVFQPYTCDANVNPVVEVGAVPVFVDIDPETYCIDVTRIEEKISGRTRAIVAIHWGGRPADMDALRRIARKRGIRLIEDACVAHGAEWKGRKVGALGDLGAFSFGCGKLIQCGEAGIVVTNSRRLAEACHHIRDRGRKPDGDVYTIGSNSRVSEILSAVLLEQLRRYPAQLRRRSRNAAHLTKALGAVRGLRLLKPDARITAQGYCHFVFRFREEEFGISRDRFIEAMQAEGIPIRGNTYPVPVYESSLFRKGLLHKHYSHLVGYRPRADYGRRFYPHSDRAYRREALSLPHPCLLGTKGDMDDIVKAVVKIRERVGDLK